MRSTDLGVVRYEHEAPIARIVLNNLEQANAQSSAMVQQVDECLDRTRYDYDIKVVILKAKGKGFCAGHVMKPGAYQEFDEAVERGGKNWQGSRKLFVDPTLRL